MIISDQALNLASLFESKQYQGMKLCKIIENCKAKHANLKNEHKRVVTTIEKYKTEYSRMKRENELVLEEDIIIKSKFKELTDKIGELEKVNTDYRKKLYSCCKDDAVAYLDPHAMHTKIRTLENKTILL